MLHTVLTDSYTQFPHLNRVTTSTRPLPSLALAEVKPPVGGYRMYANSLVELIGNTPLLHLKSLSDEQRNIRVYGKLECHNPGYSVKDRSALQLLRHLRSFACPAACRTRSRC